MVGVCISSSCGIILRDGASSCDGMTKGTGFILCALRSPGGERQGCSHSEYSVARGSAMMVMAREVSLDSFSLEGLLLSIDNLEGPIGVGKTPFVSTSNWISFFRRRLAGGLAVGAKKK